ncbi:hypothetical protein ACPA9J_31585 [Pseudomonas aeruginosa]
MISKAEEAHPPGRRYGRRHRRHQHAAVEHPGGPGDPRTAGMATSRTSSTW